jgi:hypothetical protein
MLLEHDLGIDGLVREEQDVHPEGVGGGWEIEGCADLVVSKVANG